MKLRTCASNEYIVIAVCRPQSPVTYSTTRMLIFGLLWKRNYIEEKLTKNFRPGAKRNSPARNVYCEFSNCTLYQVVYRHKHSRFVMICRAFCSFVLSTGTNSCAQRLALTIICMQSKL